MESLSHSCIVHFHEMYYDTDYFYIITEMAEIDLLKYLQLLNDNNKELTENCLKSVAK